MRITNVEGLHLRVEQVAEIADGTQDVLIARVHTDEGIIGHGEIVSAPTVAKAVIDAPRSAIYRHGLKEILLGTDPLDPPSRWVDMYEGTRWYGRSGVVLHAMSGIDTALWDIVGQHQQRSVGDLWGRRRETVRAYASALFPSSGLEAAAMASQFVELGYTAIKFGWGTFGFDRQHDLALLRSIRSAVGDAVDVMVDVGRRWTSLEAVDRAEELFSEFGITWLEEPLNEDDLEGYRTLSTVVNGRIASGETEAGLGAFKNLLRQGVKVIQPDVGRAGGLTVCREVSKVALESGSWCIPHCFGTGVNLAASLQWASSVEEIPLFEFSVTASPLRNQLVCNAPELRDGKVAIPNSPGIGIELDEEVVRRFVVR